jgi:fructose-1,6-bisphosphatase II
LSTNLAHAFLPVVEAAAIASARTMGYGDRKRSDRVAVEAMRGALSSVAIRGRIVIGEGERDEAPMLWIGEPVGRGQGADPRVDIAVDPLEGTNLCATGAPSSVCVLAASEEGGLLHAPDCYMEKLVVGPRCKGAVRLDAGVAENLAGMARALHREVSDLVVVVLDRPRHERLVEEVRGAGARIRLISDGDLAPAIGACVTGTGVHAVMGTGGAPEGVLSAAAVRCLGGEMQGRLVEHSAGDRARAVTTGELLRGVTFFGQGARTHSVVMSLEKPQTIRFVDTIHVDERKDLEIRL